MCDLLIELEELERKRKEAKKKFEEEQLQKQYKWEENDNLFPPYFLVLFNRGNGKEKF